jgi:hypothetical protein
MLTNSQRNIIIYSSHRAKKIADMARSCEKQGEKMVVVVVGGGRW